MSTNYKSSRWTQRATIIAGIVLNLFLTLILTTGTLNSLRDLFLGESHCGTCVSTSITTLVILFTLFLTGGTLVGYGLANLSPTKNKISQIIPTVIAVSLATIPFYYGINLLVNGL